MSDSSFTFGAAIQKEWQGSFLEASTMHCMELFIVASSGAIFEAWRVYSMAVRSERAMLQNCACVGASVFVDVELASGYTNFIGDGPHARGKSQEHKANIALCHQPSFPEGARNILEHKLRPTHHKAVCACTFRNQIQDIKQLWAFELFWTS